ncbi:MAG: GNAT family N-acetyltransferase, partial [Actinomycetota bacterium]|nr:GNAT family N-acetyltransferase [Actinomycetota bacterium]
MLIRKYNAEKDKKAICRIWEEIGWIQKEKSQKESVGLMLDCSEPWVCEYRGLAESVVLTIEAELNYLNEKLTHCAVNGVSSSTLVRKQGFTRKLIAHAIMKMVEKGAHTSSLHMFDQGYYNKLGFGTGAYKHYISFDPNNLNIKTKPRIPVRLTVNDWRDLHACRINRVKYHGAIDIIPEDFTKANYGFLKNSFIFVYKENGKITHFLVGCTDNIENGPYHIECVFNKKEQFLELLAFIKTLGEQVRCVKLIEPPFIQMQDFLERPFLFREITKQGKYQNTNIGEATWQVRICDLQKCISVVKNKEEELEFNLLINDPIKHYLPDNSIWKG